jgi:major membrane immunogen (membrane-anchored lipoprotein)
MENFGIKTIASCIKEIEMNKKRTAIVIILMLCLLTAGCAKSTVRVKQNNGTYRTSTHLIFQRDFADRSFSSNNDYMVSTGYNDVTYVWPQGKGNFSRKFNKISFEGKSINCSVVERRLTINGRQIVEFEQGDRVRITGDGKVFVNDAELKQE